MRVSDYITALPSAFANWRTIFAYPKEARRYCNVLDDVQAMTTASTMHLLNTAVSFLEEGECYLEVGTWRGATFIGAMLGHDGAEGYAIDDDSMDGHDGDSRLSRDVWQENVARYAIPHAHYIPGKTPDVWASLSLPPVGVYFFDGGKASEAEAWGGIAGVLPYLAQRALIILDDANELPIRLASLHLQQTYPNNALLVLDMPTPNNCWPGFWNGFHMLAWAGEGVWRG